MAWWRARCGEASRLQEASVTRRMWRWMMMMAVMMMAVVVDGVAVRALLCEGRALLCGAVGSTAPELTIPICV